MCKAHAASLFSRTHLACSRTCAELVFLKWQSLFWFLSIVVCLSLPGKFAQWDSREPEVTQGLESDPPASCLAGAAGDVRLTWLATMLDPQDSPYSGGAAVYDHGWSVALRGLVLLQLVGFVAFSILIYH